MQQSIKHVIFVDISKTKIITFINKLYAKNLYQIGEVSNSLQENHVPQPDNNSDSISLKNNSKSTTASSSSSSITVPKRYFSKFKKGWLSNPQYSSFLKECKN